MNDKTVKRTRYPNMSQMRKARLIIVKKHPVCEVCEKKKTKHIHHKDFSRDNHSIDNFLAVCTKCHGKIHKSNDNKKTKYALLLGVTLEELADCFGVSIYTILKRVESGTPLDGVLTREPNKKHIELQVKTSLNEYWKLFCNNKISKETYLDNVRVLTAV